MGQDRMAKKAMDFDSAIQDRHSIEGLVLPTVVLPPVGRDDYQTGNFENCAIWTGEYVAAQSLKYAITGELEARALAKEGVSALHKLQDITGEEGLVARGYKHGNETTWDEDFFWKKRGDRTRQGNEWHQADGGYRWLGDTSKSQVFGVAFGYFAFNKFCNPTEAEKKEMGVYFSRIVDRINDSGGKIVDSDGVVSGYGNYSPKQYLGVGGIGPSLMLTKLRLAEELTGNDNFGKEYKRLLKEEGYLKFLKRSRLNPPVLRQLSTSFGSEDNLAMLNYYMLMGLEDDEEILGACMDGLEKRMAVINDPENSLFNFAYHSMTGKDRDSLELGVGALEKFPTEKRVPLVALKRRLPSSKLRVARDVLIASNIPIEERPVDEYLWRVNPLRKDEWAGDNNGVMEFTGVDFLLAMWMGKYHRII
jgi:hypothetical protein